MKLLMRLLREPLFHFIAIGGIAAFWVIQRIATFVRISA